jgi:hypothetical protein
MRAETRQMEAVYHRMHTRRWVRKQGERDTREKTKSGGLDTVAAVGIRSGTISSTTTSSEAS